MNFWFIKSRIILRIFLIGKRVLLYFYNWFRNLFSFRSFFQIFTLFLYHNIIRSRPKRCLWSIFIVSPYFTIKWDINFFRFWKNVIWSLLLSLYSFFSDKQEISGIFLFILLIDIFQVLLQFILIFLRWYILTAWFLLNYQLT